MIKQNTNAIDQIATGKRKYGFYPHVVIKRELLPNGLRTRAKDEQQYSRENSFPRIHLKKKYGRERLIDLHDKCCFMHTTIYQYGEAS